MRRRKACLRLTTRTERFRRGGGAAVAMETASELENDLRAGLLCLDVEPRDALVAAFASFLDLLIRWNRAFNLTGSRDPADLLTRHIFDSLSIKPFLRGVSVLDVGTGAGLPGLPLALAEPGRHFTLLDSGGKKVRFVRHAVGELSLRNVTVVQARVEEYDPADPFDTVLCRAFTSVPDFVRRCGGLVASGGRLLAMKGRLPTQELRDLPVGWRNPEVNALTVPGLDAQRHVVILKRT